MTIIQLELPPLTIEQREAILACRFVTTNVPRDHAWLIFDDQDIIRRLGSATRRTETYTKDSVTGTKEHEALVSHPEAIELVVAIMGRRDAKRHESSARG